ncbi:hypothetical protein [Streptomyces sp. NPDC053069]|uniref:hypothetical protein n=1 Tax=Streptomyces sp. NPDC053069 TaxID=3365695 RepID=UPI0037CDFF9A
MSLAACIAKPAGSCRFDPMRFGIERYASAFSAYKHGHRDGQNCHHGRQRHYHVTHLSPTIASYHQNDRRTGCAHRGLPEQRSRLVARRERHVPASRFGRSLPPSGNEQPNDPASLAVRAPGLRDSLYLKPYYGAHKGQWGWVSRTYIDVPMQTN